MSDIKDKLEKAREEVKEKRLTLAEAQAEYDLALLKVKDLQRRVFYDGNTEQKSLKQHSNGEEDETVPKKSKKEVKSENKNKDGEEKPSKPSKPSKPTPPSGSDKPSKPSKPSKTSKPSPKEEDSSEDEEEEQEIPDSSSKMKATEAQKALRDMDDNPLEEVAQFIEGDSRKTVKDVASEVTGHDFHEESAESVLGSSDSEESDEEDEEESKPTPPSTPDKTEDKADSEEKEESEEKNEELDKTIDELTDGEEVPEDFRVELPEGVDRPSSAPNCFGNSEVYDPDSSRCMVCIFDFECKEAQEAMKN